MKRYSSVTTLWCQVFWLLHSFLYEFVNAEDVRPYAAKACSLWFQNAADGVETTQGTYRALWAAAEHVMAEANPMSMLGRADDVESRIPLDKSPMPFESASLYASIWQAAQLAGWDRATIHRISKRISKLIPSDLDAWYELEVVPLDDPVARLARRAFDVMYEHECVNNPICDRAAEIWAREDRMNDRWIENERLAREGI